MDGFVAESRPRCPKGWWGRFCVLELAETGGRHGATCSKQRRTAYTMAQMPMDDSELEEFLESLGPGFTPEERAARRLANDKTYRAIGQFIGDFSLLEYILRISLGNKTDLKFE